MTDYQQWVVAAIAVLPMTVIMAIAFGVQLVRWTKISNVGAGRTVFVGIHGFRNEVVMIPHPLQVEKTTAFISPLFRARAYVDPDADEMVFKMAFQPEGAPSSDQDSKRAIAELRVQWSVARYVPEYDVRGAFDHDRIPENCKVEVYDEGVREVNMETPSLLDETDPPQMRAIETARHYNKVRVQKLYPHPIRRLVPGPAAIALMNEYGSGEHIKRLLQGVIHQARTILGAVDYKHFTRVLDEADKPFRFLLEQFMVREKRVSLQSLQDALREDPSDENPDPQDPIPTTYSNKGELYACLNQLLTVIVQLELEPYGIYISQVNLIDVVLPEDLVDASYIKEGMKHKVSAMETFGSSFGNQVRAVKDTGVDPNIAALLLADTMGSESRPGVFAALQGLISSMLKTGGGK